MGLFETNYRQQSRKHREVYAFYEIIFTVVDFIAGVTFLVGSVMFLSAQWTPLGTWLFIVGSAGFALKPTIRLVRELRLARIGDKDDLAARFNP